MAIRDLGAGDLHLWRLELAGRPESLAMRFLNAGERERAARFVHSRDRARYILAHAGLRAILSSYLGMQPAALAFSQEGSGKPMLPQAPALQFNLSHSSDMALIGIGRQSAIGVDIESVAPRCDLRELAATVFSPAECRDLAEVDESHLQEAFLTGWTRKEACLKAIGDGLLRDPQSVETGISARPRRVQVTTVHGSLTIEVSSVVTAYGYVSAVAVAQPLRELKIFDWFWPAESS